MTLASRTAWTTSSWSASPDRHSLRHVESWPAVGRTRNVDRSGDCGSAGRSPRTGSHPPRSETGQCDDYAERPCQGARLRHRQVAGAARARRDSLDGDRLPHRNSALHVSRAGPGKSQSTRARTFGAWASFTSSCSPAERPLKATTISRFCMRSLLILRHLCATLRPDAPQLASQIIDRCLQKDPADRYQSAAEVVRDASDAFGPGLIECARPGGKTAISVDCLRGDCCSRSLQLLAAVWFFHRSSKRQWAREDAIPQIASLIAAGKPLAAFGLLEKAQSYLPGDPAIKS